MPRVGHAARRGESGEAQHSQMRVADHPIGKVYGLVDRHLRLQRTLNTHGQVKNCAGHYEAQRQIALQPARAAGRQQKIGHHDNDVDSEESRCRNGADLRVHRNHRENIVMGAVERVEEEQHPEPQHGKEVTEDRFSGSDGNHEVKDGQRHGRDVQANGVVNPQAAESRAARSWNQFRHDIPHGIGQQGKHQAADDVPAGNVKVFQAAREEGRQELNRRQDEAQHHESVDHQRKFRPFQRLAETREYQNPAGNDNDKIPDGEQPFPQARAGNRTSGKHGHGVIEEREEGIGQPAEQNALGVAVAHAPPGKPGRVANHIRQKQLGGCQGAEQNCDEQGDQRGDAVRFYQPGFNLRTDELHQPRIYNAT